jgi:hypothetical protein
VTGAEGESGGIGEGDGGGGEVSVFLISTDLSSATILPEPRTSSFDSWKSVVTPIANLTRFHRALPMVLATWTSEDLGALPATIVPCLPLRGSIVETGRRFGVALPTDNLDWRLPSSPCSVLTTDGEVPLETDIPALRSACEGVRMQIDKLSGFGG